MKYTIVEKILINHAQVDTVKPGDIVDVSIDVRCARDFGGANVVKNLLDNKLKVEDNKKTYFTFDCNPGGSDQKYAVNQHFCRRYARERGIKVYDITEGIGTHVAIDEGLATPGSTFVSTDSHANIMGAIAAFGQGMGDQDVAAIFAHGFVWFKVPKSVKIIFKGKKPKNITAKDIVFNLLKRFGSNTLLGYAVEFYGEAIDALTLDERITIASMGTEMGAIVLLFPPTKEIYSFFEKKTGAAIPKVEADPDAHYEMVEEIDIGKFIPMAARPGSPADVIDLNDLAKEKIKIDSAFIGSCTNGRMEDLRIAAHILKGKKVAPGVILKVVPATDKIWMEAQDEGLINIFKQAGAMVSNAGCAGCAAGQVGQNGEFEIVVSTGNRNFPGKQGKGEVYLVSAATAAASALSGYITTEEKIAKQPLLFKIKPGKDKDGPLAGIENHKTEDRSMQVTGKVWLIDQDDIDTDMIFHNRYLTITDIKEMGKYAFDNLKGYQDFALKAEPGDIIITRRNFGSGSSRQQAVDCFKSLGISLILAQSFGAIYERNAINSAFPILTYDNFDELDLMNHDPIQVDLQSGEIKNLRNGKSKEIKGFSEVQNEIFQRGGLLRAKREGINE